MRPRDLSDSVPLKLGGFAAVLVVAFLAAFGVGTAVGGGDETEPTSVIVPDTSHGGVHDEDHGS